MKFDEFGGVMRSGFHILTTILLTLLLPLSFLLLARLSTANYFSLSPSPSPSLSPSPSTTFLYLFFFNTKPTILHFLLSILTLSTLAHGLTGGFQTQYRKMISQRARLCGAWLFLCVLQICVGLGIEGSIAANIDASTLGQEKSLVCRVLFFIGLHETMRFWWWMVVKPVVDDTIFGGQREGGIWALKVGMTVVYGWLWWWKVREEVEAMAVVVEVKRDLMMRIGMADFMGWWLYYITLAIGIVRVVKTLIHSSLFSFTSRRIDDDHHHHHINYTDSILDVDHKV